MPDLVFCLRYKNQETLNSTTFLNNKIQFKIANNHFKRPTQVQDIQAIIRRAHKQNQQVTVISAIRSTTEYIVGSSIIISIKNIACILSVNRKGLTVTIEGGITLRQLYAYLRKLGL
ncbi:Ankyrin-3 [Fusarium oxysporum f. sp. albedinis]|nr:Ankyrin-3 [Fusarium oxysporum f. sp. albedinis]